jgi:4'-phosphopantetheinyl transferase
VVRPSRLTIAPILRPDGDELGVSVMQGLKPTKTVLTPVWQVNAGAANVREKDMPPASDDRRNRTATSPNQFYSSHRNARSLGPDEVAVWWLATESSRPADWNRWLGMLRHEERERAARFHLGLDRREFIAAHALLRAMLTFYLDRPAPAWRFSTDASGKPALAGEMALPEFQFNLSHTRGLVAVAVAAHGKLGIDVEKIDRDKADFSIAETYFAASEAATLRRVPEPDRPNCFFRLWTLKEAYLKAIGTGLATPLDTFAFAFDPIRISFANAGDDPSHWYFEMLPASDQHLLSLAISRASDTVRVVARAIPAGEI